MPLDICWVPACLQQSRRRLLTKHRSTKKANSFWRGVCAAFWWFFQVFDILLPSRVNQFCTSKHDVGASMHADLVCYAVCFPCITAVPGRSLHKSSRQCCCIFARVKKRFRLLNHGIGLVFIILRLCLECARLTPCFTVVQSIECMSYQRFL